MVWHTKSQEMFKMLYIKKLFPFMDAGFQREPMAVTYVKSSPNKHSPFFLKSHIKSQSGPVLPQIFT